jgi:hypothetical protein
MTLIGMAFSRMSFILLVLSRMTRSKKHDIWQNGIHLNGIHQNASHQNGIHHNAIIRMAFN